MAEFARLWTSFTGRRVIRLTTSTNAGTREMAGEAKAELQRRGQEPAAGGASGLQSMATWWREFQADADAMDRAIECEHQAAVNDAQPWPPRPETGSLARGTRCRCTRMRNATRVRPARDTPGPRPTPSPRHPSWNIGL